MAKVLKIIGLGDLAGQTWRIHLSFWSMLALTFFLFGDQNLISPNLSRIGEEFGFTEKEDYLWYIASMPQLPFFILGGIISVAMGALTDSWDRKKLLTASVVLGESACLLTAWAPNYEVYLVLRTLTGIGMGGIFPVIFSLLGDFFQNKNRLVASAWLSTAMGFGILVGQVLAMGLAHTNYMGMSGWRISFIIMAVPAFPLVVIYYLYSVSPARGAADKRDLEISDQANQSVIEEHKVSLKDITKLFNNRTNMWAFLQGIPGTVPWGFLFYFLVDYYEKTKGFSVEEATALVIVFGPTIILGTFLGGYIGRIIYHWKKHLLPLFCAITVTLGTIPVLILTNYVGTTIGPMLGTAFIAGLIIPMTGANVRGILINVNVPEDRGAVFGMYNFADDLGKAFGPGLIGLMLLAMKALFPENTSEVNQTFTYNFSICLWIVCGLCWIPMIWTMEPDEKNATERMLKSVKG